MICLDSHFFASPGEMSHQLAFGKEQVMLPIPGLCFETCQKGKLTKRMYSELDRQIKRLCDDPSVALVTANCGFFHNL